MKKKVIFTMYYMCMNLSISILRKTNISNKPFDTLLYELTNNNHMSLLSYTTYWIVTYVFAMQINLHKTVEFIDYTFHSRMCSIYIYWNYFFLSANGFIHFYISLLCSKNIVLSQRKSRWNNITLVGVFVLCENKSIITLLHTTQILWSTTVFSMWCFCFLGFFLFLCFVFVCFLFFFIKMFFINDVLKIKQIILS